MSKHEFHGGGATARGVHLQRRRLDGGLLGGGGATRPPRSPPHARVRCAARLLRFFRPHTPSLAAPQVASAATAAVLRAQGASSDAVAAKLCGAQAAPAVCDRLAAVHRLNEHFAACGSFEDAEALARALATGRPSLGAALVALMVDGDALVELVVQLMHSLSLHADGAAMLLRAGALPVLAATLRADEPLLRAQVRPTLT
jgi:hypothetical protein